ncbi:hypothetical protein MNB_SV-15-905 [hydrothermal vent metagenome]|uniref:Indole-3-glycerol-phosphate synthase n=1 Tax=hydrothermal vent metagenome TaxID=652676 RepID=A0A1W1EKD3_9ZZZZ
MKVFGHIWIDSKPIKRVYSIDDIKNSNPNSILLLEPLIDSIELAKYCQLNSISYALSLSYIKDAIFANALNASYIIVEEEDAYIIQPIAQHYLFDTEILVLISDEESISRLAIEGIDGVVFANAIQ